MLEEIEAGGTDAALAHAHRLGDLRSGDPCVRSRADLDAALTRLPSEQRALLERTASRIESFARAQRKALVDIDVPVEGGRAGHSCIPVSTAGCYAPGGRFPLPSSVLMTVIAARVAGVKEVWVASPRPTDATMAAAAVAGADGLLAMGGVQAVASLALGLCGVPPCDMIVGPGNRWVTAAKFLVSDRVGIDMLAGPSELVVLADETADARLVAADLIAQAEHDDDAAPILVTDSPALVAQVELHLGHLLASLSTMATARAAFRNGFAFVCESIDECVLACDEIAPEHLEIITRDAQSVASRVSHAGAIFIGPASAEVLGDYGAGPNHVLPTGATSRFRAGLSALTFLRARTWLRIDDPSLARGVLADSAALARIESLEGHARSAEARRA
jgi:phosphoribosyl-ATP pyrophosphohydrolase/phosphoribosyl-AMP cyclohydrolase/histidinol dehydrogenase